jgi:hypothetical protein
MKADPVVITLTADTATLDEQLRALRLLVSQIGFALDNYLATRPSTCPHGSMYCPECDDADDASPNDGSGT